jgi:urease accessory protein
MSALRFLQLLHLADSALPIGAAAHSFGLENLVAENDLQIGDLPSFFRDYLQEAGRFDAVFVNAGYDAPSTERWQLLNEQMSAMKPSREAREASLRMGKRLATLAVETFAIPHHCSQLPAHLPLIFGIVGRVCSRPPKPGQ